MQDTKGQDPSRSDIQEALSALSRVMRERKKSVDAAEESIDIQGSDLSLLGLDNFDFAGWVLSRVRFDHADIAGADFAGARLVIANFSECLGPGASFRNATLDNASFSDAQIPRTDFSFATGVGVDFRSANLERTIFSGASLPKSDFSEAMMNSVIASTDRSNTRRRTDFTGSKFTGTTIRNCDFSDCSLEDASFEGADLVKTNFARAHLDLNLLMKCSVVGAIDFSSAHHVGNKIKLSDRSLQHMIFQKVGLRAAEFEGTDLAGTNFSDANLIESRFKNCNLAVCDFAGANMVSAVFDNCSLFNADLSISGETGRSIDLDGGVFNDCVLANANLERLHTQSDFSGCILHGANISGLRDQSYSEGLDLTNEMLANSVWSRDNPPVVKDMSRLNDFFSPEYVDETNGELKSNLFDSNTGRYVGPSKFRRYSTHWKKSN
jgi:uncharacterized protein YjbI with pentapeptide repeats